ncbi:MAG: sarcosine oxidase subunit delta, partial [Pseudomonadota bacterium]
LWFHEGGCRAWLVVERDVTTHEVFGAELAEGAR